MKLVGFILLMGLILLYFLDAALKVPMLSTEMLIHSSIRFFTGFIILGIGVFYEHKIRFKSSVYLVLALVLADDIADYYRNVDSFKLEIMILGAYMLFWGALTGYFFMKNAKREQ